MSVHVSTMEIFKPSEINPKIYRGKLSYFEKFLKLGMPTIFEF